MARFTSVPSKESIPPVLWGVIEWETPDGMNAKRAQVILRAFLEKTHRLDVMCYELKVPPATVKLYLDDYNTIPKGIVERLPRLKEAIMRNPARTLGIMDKLGTVDYGNGVKVRDDAVEDVKQKAISELNAEAQGRAGNRFQMEREARGWTFREEVRRLQRIGVYTYDSNVAKVERIGITPKSLIFFPLCEYYGIDPESFGFVGRYGEKVKKWRKEHMLK